MDLTIWSLALSRDLHRGKNVDLNRIFCWSWYPYSGSRLLSHIIFYYQDVAVEIAKELQGKPDLIIGNYSDGNIVASLLAHKLGVTQVCN